MRESDLIILPYFNKIFYYLKSLKNMKGPTWIEKNVLLDK